MTQLAHEPTRHGLVVFHGAGMLEAYHLNHPPEPRVVIDPTFATRDLLRDQLDNPPYRLLVLAAGTARLYIGAGDQLTEHNSPPFPVTSNEDTSDRRGHLHQAMRTHDNPRRWDSFLRGVDDALRADTATSALPLVLAAAEPLASRVRTRSKVPIIGVVTGNHERTRLPRLAELARPIVADHLDRQRNQALDELERAANNGRAAFGLNAVWTAACDRRIVRLLVDPSYAQPATTLDHRHVAPAPSVEPPDVIDDAVDEIIEAAARNDATITFVPLTDEQGRLAAVLRTRQRGSA